MRTLSIGISPCPNDTFIFGGLALGLVEIPGVRLEFTLRDVQALNLAALAGELPVCKVSTAVLAGIWERYGLLRAGGALGRGVGPLLVARPGAALADLDGRSVAVPGRHTTGRLLFALRCARAGVAPRLTEMIFSEVMPAVVRGEVAAGVVIHEGRFTYPEYGLERLEDLGRWWEEAYGLPVPLGGIAARRDLGPELTAALDAGIRRSLELARREPERVLPFVREHAQELDAAVQARHVATFVTEYSLDAGEEGERACAALVAEACRLEARPAPGLPMFLAAASAG
ncbi:MAG: 1,4-dihydroxy-6-naphthoate synthase [Desulfovibrionaceae bacterium]